MRDQSHTYQFVGRKGPPAGAAARLAADWRAHRLLRLIVLPLLAEEFKSEGLSGGVHRLQASAGRGARWVQRFSIAEGKESLLKAELKLHELSLVLFRADRGEDVPQVLQQLLLENGAADSLLRALDLYDLIEPLYFKLHILCY